MDNWHVGYAVKSLNRRIGRVIDNIPAVRENKNLTSIQFWVLTFLFREADERQCRRKNPYEEEHSKAFSLFINQYGLLGERLRTPEERERDKEQNVTTYHGMCELPEYKELCNRYDKEEKKLEQYREECKNKAFDLFSKWFYSLWD